MTARQLIILIAIVAVAMPVVAECQRAVCGMATPGVQKGCCCPHGGQAAPSRGGCCQAAPTPHPDPTALVAPSGHEPAPRTPSLLPAAARLAFAPRIEAAAPEAGAGPPASRSPDGVFVLHCAFLI